MEIIKADHHRVLQLAGVPDPVHRPVEIDTSQTGFVWLRSLRVYGFDAGSVIDGHAEDDEVFIVVLAGSIELTMSEREINGGSPTFTVSTVGNAEGAPCVAYLPPKGAYRLVAQSRAEVAYARATPPVGRAPAVFAGKVQSDRAGTNVVFAEADYPQRLRLRIVHVKAADESLHLSLIEQSESGREALIHLRTESERGAMSVMLAGAAPTELQSWDTVAIRPEERPMMRLAAASSAVLLVVLASA